MIHIQSLTQIVTAALVAMTVHPATVQAKPIGIVGKRFCQQHSATIQAYRDCWHWSQVHNAIVRCHSVGDATRDDCRWLVSAAHEEHVPYSWTWYYGLHYIIRHESGFDRCAVNPSRHICFGVPSTSACGLFQRLPCPWRNMPSSFVEDKNGLDYIKRNYTTPQHAYIHWLANGSY